MQINARAITGAVISRHKHGEQISIPTAHTVPVKTTTYRQWAVTKP